MTRLSGHPVHAVDNQQHIFHHITPGMVCSETHHMVGICNRDMSIDFTNSM